MTPQQLDALMTWVEAMLSDASENPTSPLSSRQAEDRVYKAFGFIADDEGKPILPPDPPLK